MQHLSKSSDSSRTKRLNSYALVAGAIALAPAAHGGTITTVEVNQVLTEGGPTFDLTTDGGPDLTFAVVGDALTATAEVTGGSASYALDTVTLAPLASQPGDTIGPSNTFATAENGLASCKFLEGCSGEFPTDGSTQYLGFEFSPSGGTDYGYVDLSITGSEYKAPALTLDSFTYDSSGAPIAIPTPEPSSFALLAAGATGIAALRARRKARR
jgi:hypothetical protein